MYSPFLETVVGERHRALLAEAERERLARSAGRARGTLLGRRLSARAFRRSP